MPRGAWLAVVVVSLSCNRSLDVADPPAATGPGVITGRAVFARPGRTQREPAGGAQVSLLGSGARATSDPQGNFQLEGITREVGQLLFRFDSDGDGAFDRQKLVALEALKAGPGRQLAIGEILLVENARLHGRVRRADVATGGGHGGSLAFVPETPFIATSGDDGTYAFDELPDGDLRVAFFRTGYLPDGFSEVSLGGGEDLGLRDVVLQKQPAGQLEPARLTGRVVLVPDGGRVDEALVRLTEVGTSMSSTAVPASTGQFSFMQVPGVYHLSVSLPGYVTADLPNLLLPSGESGLGDVALVAGSGGSGGGAGGGAGGGGAGGGSGGGATTADGGPVRPVAVFPGIRGVRTNDPNVVLDGRQSYDPLDAGPLIYSWADEDGGIVPMPNNSLLAATATFKAPATAQFLRFTLTVTSQSLVSSAPTVGLVEVIAPPTGRVVPASLMLGLGASQQLTAMVMDPAGAALTYAWSTDGGVTLSSTSGPVITVTAGMTPTTTSVRLVPSNAQVSGDPIDVPVVVQ